MTSFNSEKVYTLITTDNDLFEMNSEDMTQSPVFTQVAALADTRTDLTVNDPIPIPRVNSKVMKLIQAWCQAMRINEPSTSTWRSDFLAQLDEKQLRVFVGVCDHLGIKSVLDETKRDMIRRMTQLKPGETLCFTGKPAKKEGTEENPAKKNTLKARNLK